MKLVWTREAVRDLVEARSYVEPDNPKAAAELSRRIVNAVERLIENPKVGREGRLHSTRELVVTRTHYLIIYRIYGKRIDLLRILHTNRQFPRYP
ncbi:MAG TPA: type II toxin-antitoxin system RelE/ParE family toxin [Pyrinomonadaceae bacterium]|nr:type II toxin-antitoxin system RelE/ParE family toxin [Pyrinomonadaceae bacterium]